MSRYHEVYAAWKKDPEAFWAEAAREIDWINLWDKVFDPYAGEYGRWFAGAECNTAYNCLDRHVLRGRGQQKALIYDSPVTKTTKSLHLRRPDARGGDARRRAAGPRRQEGRPRHHLHADGAGSRHRHARLRAHRRHPLGRVRRLCGERARHPHQRFASPSPSSPPVAASRPARVIPYKPLLDKAIELAEHKPTTCVILQRPHGKGEPDCRPRSRLGRARRATPRRAAARPAACPSPPPTRSTSSTRPAPPAQPKGVIRDNGGHMVALKWTMQNHYGIEPGEVFWAASDVGWVVGHSYIVYAPLLHGATIDPLRGQARRHAGRRRLLARHRRAQGGGHVHRADRLPRHQEGRSRRAS